MCAHFMKGEDLKNNLVLICSTTTNVSSFVFLSSDFNKFFRMFISDAQGNLYCVLGEEQSENSLKKTHGK